MAPEFYQTSLGQVFYNAVIVAVRAATAALAAPQLLEAAEAQKAMNYAAADPQAVQEGLALLAKKQQEEGN